MASDEERSSKLGDSEPPPDLSPDEVALREAENTLRQYDRLVELIRGSIGAGRLRLRPSTLMGLNRLAVDGLVKSAGALRRGPIEILNSRHTPPPWEDVAALIDDMCEYVNEGYGKNSSCRVCDVEAELDSPLCGWQWAYVARCVLLRALRRTRSTLAWATYHP